MVTVMVTVTCIVTGMITVRVMVTVTDMVIFSVTVMVTVMVIFTVTACLTVSSEIVSLVQCGLGPQTEARTTFRPNLIIGSKAHTTGYLKGQAPRKSTREQDADAP